MNSVLNVENIKLICKVWFVVNSFVCVESDNNDLVDDVEADPEYNVLADEEAEHGKIIKCVMYKLLMS